MVIDFFMPSRTKAELYVLMAISELVQQKENSNVVDRKDIAGHLHESVDKADSILENLDGQGLVKYIKHTYGCEASLTAAGINKISEINDFLNSPNKRQKYLRDMYLTWIYDQNTIEKFPETQEFLNAQPGILNYRYTESNVVQAEMELMERAFIRSDELTPGLAVTAQGQDYVDNK